MLDHNLLILLDIKVRQCLTCLTIGKLKLNTKPDWALRGSDCCGCREWKHEPSTKMSGVWTLNVQRIRPRRHWGVKEAYVAGASHRHLKKAAPTKWKSPMFRQPPGAVNVCDSQVGLRTWLSTGGAGWMLWEKERNKTLPKYPTPSYKPWATRPWNDLWCDSSSSHYQPGPSNQLPNHQQCTHLEHVGWPCQQAIEAHWELFTRLYQLLL